MYFYCIIIDADEQKTENKILLSTTQTIEIRWRLYMNQAFLYILDRDERNIQSI